VWNVVADLQVGLLDGPSVGVLGAYENFDFWSSYLSNGDAGWTLADLQSEETMRSLVFPLILQTMVILAACRPTVERLMVGPPRLAAAAD
jgi:hypothetical protein